MAVYDMDIPSLARFISNRDWYYIIRNVHDTSNVITEINGIVADAHIDVFQDDDPENPPYVLTTVITVNMRTVNNGKSMTVMYRDKNAMNKIPVDNADIENIHRMGFKMESFEFVLPMELPSIDVGMDDYRSCITVINDQVISRLTNAIRKAIPENDKYLADEDKSMVVSALSSIGVVIIEKHDLMRNRAAKLK